MKKLKICRGNVLHLLCIFYLLLVINLQANYHHEIMSYDEYATLRYGLVEYVFSDQSSTIFYFGANHSCQPDNEQYPLLRKLWFEFLERTGGLNCVVLIEGSLRGSYQNEDDAIMHGGGEGGLITYLAGKAKINVMCPEPNSLYMGTELLKHFSSDELNYRRFGHIGQQYHRYKKNNPDLKFEQFYDSYHPDISFNSIQEIHLRLFNTQLDVEDEKWFYDISNPVIIKSKMNLLARQASRIRDEAIVDFIAQLKKQGKNIFIVYGQTHAVMQKKAIENLFL